MLKLLFIGDVVGRPGREIVAERLPRLRAEHGLDFVIANGENAAGGAGLTARHRAFAARGGGRCRHPRRPPVGPEGF